MNPGRIESTFENYTTMPGTISLGARNDSANPKIVLVAGLVAGVLDIIAAIVYRTFVTGDLDARPILKYIASGVFGKDALQGGANMVILGLIFHFFIALGFAFLYWILYRNLGFLRKYVVIGGLLYGILVWIIMNRVVVPLSNTPKFSTSFGVKALIQMGILMVCIGLPVSLIIHKNTLRTVKKDE